MIFNAGEEKKDNCWLHGDAPLTAGLCVYGNPDCQICKNFPNVFDAGTSLHYSNLSDPTFKSHHDARLLAHFLTSLSDIIAEIATFLRKLVKRK